MGYPPGDSNAWGISNASGSYIKTHVLHYFEMQPSQIFNTGIASAVPVDLG